MPSLTTTTKSISSKNTPTQTSNNSNVTMTAKNFKNLTISTHPSTVPAISQFDDMKCQCSHYFNTECTTDPLLSTENIPSTVKSVSDDSCCTYGTHYPNRIFVGHLPGKANATDLADFFRKFGTVLEGKVVLDSFGRSRRFGFVTFANHDDVQNVLSQTPIFFKGKKINVGPAVKKMFGAEFSPPLSPSATSGSSSGDAHSSEDESEQKNLSETIITVPPVNEAKDPSAPTTPKSGNIWLKINTKPKMVSKKSPDNNNLPSTILPPRFVYPPNRQTPQQQPFQQQQQGSNLPYFYPMFTLPCNQAYSYQGAYYTQSPLPYFENNGQVFYMSPPPMPQQWNNGSQTMFLPTVA